jgi:hypothetical protein
MNCAELDERLRAWLPYEGGLDWLRDERDLEPCIAEGLRVNREAGDWLAFEKYVVAAQRHPSPSYTETLGAVLDERHEDINNEDIIDALNDAQDPAAVPSLRRAVTWVPDTDEFGQQPRKVVWALGRIGTPEAIDAIREEVTPDLPSKVVEAAEQVLKDR